MNIKRNRSAELVSNVFFLTVFTFFLTSLMTTLGSVIDGFIIGNTMGTKEIGVPEDRELTATPATIEEVAAFSQQIYDFCLQHGVGPRQANITSLAAEEMAKNVIEHGFTKDNRRHSMELRLICKNDELILRIRDNCRLFDPIKRLATINENPDPTAYIGIRMIMKLATDVSYTTTMKQNNLMIKVALQ